MGFLEKVARNRVLGQAKDAIEKSVKQGRLKFCPDGKIEYTDKAGARQTLTLKGCADLFWMKMDNEMSGTVDRATGQAGMGLAVLGVTPDDILKIIEGFRDRKK
jgi:hypothetical protein